MQPDSQLSVTCFEQSFFESSTESMAGEEINANCNYNPANPLNPEFCPNEGCGCIGSYNGGAGGGTAACCEQSCPVDFSVYQAPLVNKKPCEAECSTEFKFVPGYVGPPPVCPPKETSCHVELPRKKFCCPYNANSYHRPQGNCTPICMDHYVPEIASHHHHHHHGDPHGHHYDHPHSDHHQADHHHSRQTNCGCKDCPDTYELIRNTDAQKYKGVGLDRSYYFSDC